MPFLISDPFMYGTNEDEFGKTRFIVALICIFLQWISFCLTFFSDVFLLSYCRAYTNLYCCGCFKQQNSASELHILSWSYLINCFLIMSNRKGQGIMYLHTCLQKPFSGIVPMPCDLISQDDKVTIHYSWGMR